MDQAKRAAAPLKAAEFIDDAAGDTPCLLYRCFDRADVLLYVGITSNGLQRLKQHLHTAKWLRFADTLDLVRYPSRPLAAVAELDAIRTENPVFNRVGRRRELWLSSLTNYVGAEEARRLADPKRWSTPTEWHPNISDQLASLIVRRRRRRIAHLILGSVVTDAPAADTANPAVRS